MNTSLIWVNLVASEDIFQFQSYEVQMAVIMSWTIYKGLDSYLGNENFLLLLLVHL